MGLSACSGMITHACICIIRLMGYGCAIERYTHTAIESFHYPKFRMCRSVRSTHVPSIRLLLRSSEVRKGFSVKTAPNAISPRAPMSFSDRSMEAMV